MPKTLVWLASYPKSGNTWLRAFLANYFLRSDGPIPLDRIRRVSFGDSGMEAYVRRSPLDHRRLKPHQLLQLRLSWLDEVSRRGAVNFVKTHNAHTRLGPGWWIPAQMTTAAIYIARDPRDMVLSYADHWGIPVDRAIEQIADKRNSIDANPKSVVQFLGSWSSHVESWTKSRDFRVMTLRYEDMIADPRESFSRVLRHVGAPVEQAILENAIRCSDFKQLAGDEAAHGFSERGPRQETFFRKGIAGGWKDALSDAQADAIVRTHRSAMKRLGYPVD